MVHESNSYYDRSNRDSWKTRRPESIDGEFEGVISQAIEGAVSQYHNLLHHGLDLEVKRIIEEFQQATDNIDMVIARRVRSRLVELVQEEVRRVFDETLVSAEETIVDPIWAKARDTHLSFVTDYTTKSNDYWGPDSSENGRANSESQPVHGNR